MKSTKFLIFFAIFFFGAMLFNSKLHAQSSSSNLNYSYPEYTVDIKINQDSSFEVIEKTIYQFYGTAHGIRRDLTLSDPSRDCTNINTCGGFDRVEVISVTDDKDNDLSGKYSLNQITDTSGKKSMRFEWAIWPNGKYLNGEKIGWTLKYKVYGGIKKIGDYLYFYWNTLPEDRTGSIKSFKSTVSFPSSVDIQQDNLKIYSDYSPNTSLIDQKLNISLNNLNTFGNLTLSYRFNSSEITLPGSISYKITSPDLGSDVYLDNVKQSITNKNIIKSVAIGEHIISFRHVGYQSIEKSVQVSSGIDTAVTVALQPENWMSVLLLLNSLLCLSSLLFIPIGILYVYMRYSVKRKSENMPKTIIPLYSPPEGIRPYLLGTIKDENVDKEDIVGTIIDLAFRGYINIKEITKNSNYELTRLQGKKGDPGLDHTEDRIMSGLFGTNNSVETVNLKYSFPYKYNDIVNRIYMLLVRKGYFKRSPKATVSSYIGGGIALMLIGFLITGCISIIVSVFLGYLSLFSPGLFLIIIGLGFLIIAKFMPAKTPLGSKVYADILGFKMYLNTAERLRLQNLGPEEFEKYLSYAIVFKIENQWAQKFQGIYNKVPDWYIGTGNVYEAIWISSFTRSFTNSTISNISPIVSKTGNGDGWSGSSGSFGGFSGGGGGGGSMGAW